MTRLRNICKTCGREWFDIISEQDITNDMVIGDIWGVVMGADENHSRIRLISEDDERWYGHGDFFSSKWIDDLISVLTETKRRLKIRREAEFGISKMEITEDIVRGVATNPCPYSGAFDIWKWLRVKKEGCVGINIGSLACEKCPCFVTLCDHGLGMKCNAMSGRLTHREFWGL